MRIVIKLFATFSIGRFAAKHREYPAGTTVGAIVTELGIPEQEIGIVLVNHRHAGLDLQLTDGDVVAIFPLVGGG